MRLSCFRVSFELCSILGGAEPVSIGMDHSQGNLLFLLPTLSLWFVRSYEYVKSVERALCCMPCAK